MHSGFACCATTPFVPDFPFPAHVSLPCPHSSVTMRYRNINLLSIGYAFQPHLRSRLSQGRSALPWRPWIFGHKDSHLVLATHSGILSSHTLKVPFLRLYTRRMIITTPVSIPTGRYTRCFLKNSNRDSARNFSIRFLQISLHRRFSALLSP